jgi:hypothetical protein
LRVGGTAVRRSARILPLLAALAAALAAGTTGTAQTLPSAGLAISFSFGARPTFAVEDASNLEGITASLAAAGAPGATPVEVVADLPAGYSAAPQAPGAIAGLGIVESASGTGENTSATFATATMVASDPSQYASDPCAGGTPVAVWTLSTSIVGLGYALPIFVGHPADDPQGLELRFCPPPLTGPDGKPLATPPVPLAAAIFILTPLKQPTTTGSYTSHAFFTPAGSTGAPNPQGTTEARFLRTVPHTLTVKGRYDKTTKDAVLAGRVAQLGKPQARAVVEYATTSGSSSVIVLGVPKQVRASAAGTFTIRTRITRTTLFVLDVAATTGPCQGASTAPGGCLSETVEGTAQRLVRIVPTR